MDKLTLQYQKGIQDALKHYGFEKQAEKIILIHKEDPVGNITAFGTGAVGTGIAKTELERFMEKGAPKVLDAVRHSKWRFPYYLGTGAAAVAIPYLSMGAYKKFNDNILRRGKNTWKVKEVNI